MYSVWRNHTRLGVLTHVQDVVGKSKERSGFGGVLLPDDPTLTFTTMSQTRLVYLPHAPIFQHISGTARDAEVCQMTTADGRQVAGSPLRAVPNDAPGVPVDDVLEIRRDDTEVILINWICMFCNDLEASAGAASTLAALGLPSNLRQMIFVSVMDETTWPPPEVLQHARVFENAT